MSTGPLIGGRISAWPPAFKLDYGTVMDLNTSRHGPRISHTEKKENPSP